MHVPAGPAFAMPKDELLPYMPAFGQWLARRWSSEPPDVVHAHFWMSGIAALAAARTVGVPVVQTFHALGAVKRRYQGHADTSHCSRVSTETALTQEVDMVVATCPDELTELTELTQLGTRPSRSAWPRTESTSSTFAPKGQAGTGRAPRAGRRTRTGWSASVEPPTLIGPPPEVIFSRKW